MSEKLELVFIPSSGLSHMIPTVELGKLLIQRDKDAQRFSSFTFLIITSSFTPTPDAYIESVSNSVPRIRFITLPQAQLPPPTTEPGLPFFSMYVENHRPLVKQAITELISYSNSSRIRVVVDMFTTCMIEVADELSIPSYVYYTSGASVLGFMLDLPRLDSAIKTDFTEYSSELAIQTYVNPVPTLALPSILLNKKDGNYASFVKHARELCKTKGVIVNSIRELEPHPVEVYNRLGGTIPRVYLVGPLLDLEGRTHSGSNRKSRDQILNWLDNQPESSVVFLCFGSRAALSAPQVKEIAHGLEHSGQRFLWSLRRPSAVKYEVPNDYANVEEVLPHGFLERVDGRGLVCGWVPQVEVLGHKAIRGFVSHCGWNSILESFWFGVPLVTWPLDAEQKLNAFELMKDLGLALEIREGFYKEEEENVLVTAEEVEKSVTRVTMEDEVRRKVKDMSEKCRKALTMGGSSWSTLGCLIKDLSN